MRPILFSFLLLTTCAFAAQPARAQEDPASAGSAPAAEALPAAPRVLEPFVATYQAYYRGRPAGSATMRLAREEAARWRIELDLRAERGVASLARLNIHQRTLFDEHDGHYRPLSQDTERRAILFGKEVAGIYDWKNMQARWEGDLSKERRRPVALQPGDMSALLINLAVIRDAAPGRTLSYRFVDGGRVRDHAYRVAAATEPVAVAGMHYEALRVERTNGGDDETILWIADGVPTPVRILQREDGEDAIDLRLVEYRGLQ